MPTQPPASNGAGASIATQEAVANEAAAREAAKLIAVVVFPTPPLPVTTSTLVCVRNVNGPKAPLL